MLNFSIVVVGSSNTDMVVKTKHFPAPGETVLGDDFLMNPGGKGANQAVTAARLGGDVVFICKIGDDLFGSQSLELLKSEGIDTSCIVLDKNHASGVALITVNANAENNIVVASGSNSELFPEDLERFSDVINQADFILMQLEIPLETVSYVAKKVSENKSKVILNPAPAFELPDDLYKHIDIITPNEKEASMLSGIKVDSLDSTKLAARAIQEKGVSTVIITLGSKGALVLSEDAFTHVLAPVVKAVDTTAAGDVFNGALTIALSEGKEMVEAVEFACKASALSVTRYGAQASVPSRSEVEEFESIPL